MVKRDLSLQRQAQQQLSVCCESVADKSIVIEYISQLEEQVRKLKIAIKVYEKLHSKLMHENPEMSGRYFICGEGGEKDELELPEYISICPSYGLDGFAMYKKHTQYSAPGY